MFETQSKPKTCERIHVRLNYCSNSFHRFTQKVLQILLRKSGFISVLCPTKRNIGFSAFFKVLGAGRGGVCLQRSLFLLALKNSAKRVPVGWTTYSIRDNHCFGKWSAISYQPRPTDLNTKNKTNEQWKKGPWLFWGISRYIYIYIGDYTTQLYGGSYIINHYKDPY